MPEISEAKRRANKKWNDANQKDRYDRIQLVVPKGQKATIQAAADQTRESINGYVSKAVLARMGMEDWPEKGEEGNA